MATRRSRLQIKPNIGGPKAPPKSNASPASQQKSQNKVQTSETVQPEPTKIEDKNPQSASKSQHADDSQIIEKNTTNDTQESTSEKTLPTSEVTDQPPVGRARLRRFGKVNIAAASSSKARSETSTETNVTVTESTADAQLKHTEAKTAARNEPASTESQAKSSGDDKDSKKPAAPLRRSRFPKAKPNVVDAAKRKQNKEPADKDTGTDDSQTKTGQQTGHAIIPNIRVIPPDHESLNKELELFDSTGTGQQQSIKEELTQIQPKISATPIPRSPQKALAPTIPIMSPIKQPAEKRARSLSTSEPNIVKKIRRIKVEAPTDQPPDRTTMKMRDLIRWNPTNNPMKTKAKGDGGVVKAKTAGEKENLHGNQKEAVVVEEEASTALPVPQVTIGPDGNIVINEKSLVVKDPDIDKGPEMDVIDETDMVTTYSSFRKNPGRSKKWTKKETTKFYKALAMIGIDFFLIQQLFPKRTRDEMKKKFQKEEKVNRELVEKCLKERIKFDASVFDKRDDADNSSSDNDEDSAKKAKKEKKKPAKSEDRSAAKKGNSGKAKKRKTTIGYYDECTDEEEVEEPAQSRESTDPTWHPPSVSGKDGEVVNILMDMSEGRLSTEGQGHVAAENTKEKLRRNIQKKGADSAAAQSGSDLVYTDGNVIYPLLGQHGQRRGQIQPSTGQTQQVLTMPADPTQAGLAPNFNVIGQGMVGLPQTINGDQYVLVTVVPEGGGETVIHIYRVHGGLQLQGDSMGVQGVLQSQGGENVTVNEETGSCEVVTDNLDSSVVVNAGSLKRTGDVKLPSTSALVPENNALDMVNLERQNVESNENNNAEGDKVLASTEENSNTDTNEPTEKCTTNTTDNHEHDEIIEANQENIDKKEVSVTGESGEQGVEMCINTNVDAEITGINNETDLEAVTKLTGVREYQHTIEDIMNKPGPQITQNTESVVDENSCGGSVISDVKEPTNITDHSVEYLISGTSKTSEANVEIVKDNEILDKLETDNNEMNNDISELEAEKPEGRLVTEMEVKDS